MDGTNSTQLPDAIIYKNVWDRAQVLLGHDVIVAQQRRNLAAETYNEVFWFLTRVQQFLLQI